MDHFNYLNDELYCEDVPAAALAEQFGTPLYVYSKATLLHHFRQIRDAFAELSPTICYSIKSNGNLHVCRILANEGCGFDVTSGGELYRALKAGGDPKKIIYAGVGKTDDEIREAIRVGIAAFNIESEAELENIDRVAASMNATAVGALRVNPDVDPRTHAKTTTGKKESKFGVDIERAERVFAQYGNLKNLRLAGVHIHIGSPVYELEPYVSAVTKMTQLIDTLRQRGHEIEWFDIGGGFGVNYKSPEQALPVTEHARVLVPLLRNKPYRIALEPGRYIAGNSGVLLTRVLYRKAGGAKQFVIVDAGMNDLLRPTLYESYHHIYPAKIRASQHAGARTEFAEGMDVSDTEKVDIVGPVCESGDYLAKDRTMPRVERGELLSVFTAGAYGMSMSSNYNNRPRPAEVIVDGSDVKLARRRETFEDLVGPELDVALDAERDAVAV